MIFCCLIIWVKSYCFFKACFSFFKVMDKFMSDSKPYVYIGIIGCMRYRIKLCYGLVRFRLIFDMYLMMPGIRLSHLGHMLNGIKLNYVQA